MDTATVDERITATALRQDRLYQGRLGGTKGIIGRALGKNPGTPTLVARVARSRGIDVGDDGRMRCPLSYSNGGEFTDLNMSNCGPKLTGAALDAIRSIGSPAEAVGVMRSARARTGANAAVSHRITAAVAQKPSRVRETTDLIRADFRQNFARRIAAVRSQRPKDFYVKPGRTQAVSESALESDRYVRSIGLNIAAEAVRRSEKVARGHEAQRAKLNERIDAADAKLTEWFQAKAEIFNTSFKNARFEHVLAGMEDNVVMRKVSYEAEDNDGNLVAINVWIPHEQGRSGSSNSRIEITTYPKNAAGVPTSIPDDLWEKKDEILKAFERNYNKTLDYKRQKYNEMKDLPLARHEFAEAVFEVLDEADVKRGNLTDDDIDRNWTVPNEQFRESLKEIAPFIPKPWLDAILDKDVRFTTTKDRRSYQSDNDDGSHTVVMSEHLFANPDEFRSVLLHELSHTIQSYNNLDEAEFVFWSRVADPANVKPLGKGYDDDEIGDPDDFDDRYIGKVYIRSGEDERPFWPREMLPMVMQRLYGRGGSRFGGDNDSLYWLLGLMAEMGR